MAFAAGLVEKLTFLRDFRHFNRMDCCLCLLGAKSAHLERQLTRWKQAARPAAEKLVHAAGFEPATPSV